MNPSSKRKAQLAIGFGIFAIAVIVSYFSVTVEDHPKNSNVILIIDTSGSMADENKLDYAKSAANQFVSTILTNNSANYKIGLVSFADQPNIISQLTNNQKDLSNGISTLEANGQTAMGDAIVAATQLLQQSEPQKGKVILLLTDGISNAGSDPVTDAQTAAQDGIIIYTVGYGVDADAATLSEISSITGGQYYPASSGNQLISSFSKIANLIISPVAHYGSRTLILIAIPILLFIPAIEKGMVTMVEKFEATMIKKKVSQIFCPKCGQANLLTAKFCAKCGNKFKDRVK
ncbi:MAG: VWA domain-containing protein [Nitrosopumilaceae archaeon]